MLVDDAIVVADQDSTARELLKAARAGDAEAFGEVCRHYERRLVRHAVTLCGDASLGEELAQETLVEAWRCLNKYNERCRFFTWLCAILLNRFRNFLRRKSGFSTAVLWEDTVAVTQITHPEPNAQPSPDEAAQFNEQADILWRCVQSLPLKHQQVIYLRFFAEDSLEGIAAALNCSIGTIKSRLFHALEKLRRMKDLEATHE